MQQLYCLYIEEDNSSKNIFNFATNFCAGVTSRFYELLLPGFSLCANSWIFLHILALFLALYINFVCILFLLIGTNWQIWILCVALYLAIVEYRTWQAGQPGIIHSQVLDHILHIMVVDPEWFVSDPTSDPNPTFKEVSAPTPEPTSDPDSGSCFGSGNAGLRLERVAQKINYC